MKQRLDTFLVENGLVSSREQAQRYILAGYVFVNSQNNVKAGHKIDTESRVEIRGKEKYVSRGGIKLEGALNAFEINVENLTCADVGTSTGGFTDCLLQHGAKRVYAIDVGKTQIHESLRNRPDVVLVENTNAKFLDEHTIPEIPNLIVVDVSFISVEKIMAGLRNISQIGTQLLILIKPQFEADPKEVSKGKGIITSPRIHFRILESVINCGIRHSFCPLKLDSCILPGVNGNHEWVALFTLSDQIAFSKEDVEAITTKACRKRWPDFTPPHDPPIL